MTRKRYSSVHKLNTLPVGSRVCWGNSYSLTWVKGEKGWSSPWSSWPIPWEAKTLLAYNGNRTYTVEPAQDKHNE
jgi:hypothetical protein